MTDLTGDFTKARTLGSRDLQRTAQLLATLARSLGGTVDWEPGDEEWGRVLRGHDVLALVAARFPLAMVVGPHPEPVLVAGAHVVVVPSTTAPDYRVDREELEVAFGRPISTVVDLDRLSIGELWWATVS